jgi:hypothetical protein
MCNELERLDQRVVNMQKQLEEQLYLIQQMCDIFLKFGEKK